MHGWIVGLKSFNSYVLFCVLKIHRPPSAITFMMHMYWLVKNVDGYMADGFS